MCKIQYRLPENALTGEIDRLLEENGVSIPKNIKAADILTLYAVETRYPGVSEKVTKTEYKTALKLASQVVSWAKEEITK